jgi:serine/threonine protein kinase
MVKKLPADDLFASEAVYERIQHELRLGWILKHPNIMRNITSFVICRELWIVQPTYLGSLYQMFVAPREREAWDESVVSYVIKSVVAAVDYLHQQGYIHRSISSSSIFVGANCNVQVGHLQHVISNLDEDGCSKTALHSRHEEEGHIPWQAPEYIRQDTTGYTDRIDMYSIGIVALELLYRAHPFAGMLYVPIVGLYLCQHRYFAAFAREVLTSIRSHPPAHHNLVHASWAPVTRPPSYPISLASLQHHATCPHNRPTETMLVKLQDETGALGLISQDCKRKPSKNLWQFLLQCLREDDFNRPSAATLLSFPFLKQTKDLQKPPPSMVARINELLALPASRSGELRAERVLPLNKHARGRWARTVSPLPFPELSIGGLQYARSSGLRRGGGSGGGGGGSGERSESITYSVHGDGEDDYDLEAGGIDREADANGTITDEEEGEDADEEAIEAEATPHNSGGGDDAPPTTPVTLSSSVATPSAVATASNTTPTTPEQDLKALCKSTDTTAGVIKPVPAPAPAPAPAPTPAPVPTPPTNSTEV